MSLLTKNTVAIFRAHVETLIYSWAEDMPIDGFQVPPYQNGPYAAYDIQNINYTV